MKFSGVGQTASSCQFLVFLARYSVCNIDPACAMLVLPTQQLLDSKFAVVVYTTTTRIVLLTTISYLLPFNSAC